jgi:Phage terminase large subunit (GpA)
MSLVRRKIAKPADVASMFDQARARLEMRTGFKVAKEAIADGVTFRDWCGQLARDGLVVDGHPFKLDNRPSMHFIYDLIPTTIEEAREKTVVMMKCAQVGFTILEMLACIYLALKFEPAKIGMYLPGRDLASIKSSIRFMPIVRTVPIAYNRLVEESVDGKTRNKGEGNVMIRQMGGSNFYFMWTSGKASTESIPLDILSFDEVQEMAIADMEKTRERLSASRIKFTLMGSTANWPDSDIHWWYKKGTQHQFHTKCPHCGESSVLEEHFPQCIGYDEERSDYRYACPLCKGWIDDTQVGEWIAKNPDARVTSVHYPQTLSPTISAREIIEAYHEADDMKNFFNRKLGKPYTDPSQVPVNLEMLNACADEGKAAGLEWKSRASGTFMGIDQMGSFNVAIIKERMPDGRQAVVHLEYIYTKPTKENPEASPFDRCDELMVQYGVECCVIETLPNYNDAKRFARRHHGKVFLAGYTDMKEDMLRWGDTPKMDASDRRTDEEERDRHTVLLDQYKCMQVSMARFVKKTCLFPDPLGLVQEVVEKGMRKTIAVCKEYAFFHFTRTALIAEKDEEQKKFRRRVVKVGIDPHTSYANMLCDVAWARANGTSTFIMPPEREAPAHLSAGSTSKAVSVGPLGSRLAELMALPPGEVCGRCSAFNAETSKCVERQVRVRATSPGCFQYVAIEQ